jgi:hypothetical protein
VLRVKRRVPCELSATSAVRGLCYNQEDFARRRYRLGVRTEDSQSSNPGSIPGSATNVYAGFLQFLLSVSLPCPTRVRFLRAWSRCAINARSWPARHSPSIAPADEIAHAKLGIGVYRRPGPKCLPIPPVSFPGWRSSPWLRRTPNFVALKTARPHLPCMPVVVGSASISEVHHQLGDSVLAGPGHPADSLDRNPFHQ